MRGDVFRGNPAPLRYAGVKDTLKGIKPTSDGVAAMLGGGGGGFIGSVAGSERENFQGKPAARYGSVVGRTRLASDAMKTCS